MKEISRRSFLSGLGIAGATGMLAGITTGCSSETSANSAAAPAAQKGIFDAPEPITDVAETLETEILVLGAGLSGVCCAYEATLQGKKVAVMQKGDSVITNGVAMSAMNVEECHEHNGLPYIDFDEKIIEHNNQNMGGVNFPLLKKFFDEEVEAVTWFLNESKAIDMGPAIWQNDTDPCLVYAPNGILPVVTTFAEKAAEMGADFHYSTPAVQLVADDSGRVVGAIGQREDGTFIQINASKGVVLATGDYGNNRELLEMWCPSAAEFESFYTPENNTGDGYLMAKRLNAKVSPIPHTKMVHPTPISSQMKRVWWLKVDLHGDRVFPENLSYGWQNNAIRGHRDATAIQIFDANWSEKMTAMGFKALSGEAFQMHADNGWMVSADTLEELAEMVGMDEDNNLVATVERYNELCAKGHDDDFYKDAKFMTAVDTAPFYAITCKYVTCAILGGLAVNTDFQVLDENDAVIEGLYAIGNAQGGIFGAGDYSYAINGGSLGRACTFGYALGRDL